MWTASDIAMFAAFLVTPLVGFWLCRRAARRRRPYPSCRECGYNLLGIVGGTPTCPECGADISKGRFLGAQRLPPLWHWLNFFGFLAATVGGILVSGLLVILAIVAIREFSVS